MVGDGRSKMSHIETSIGEKFGEEVTAGSMSVVLVAEDGNSVCIRSVDAACQYESINMIQRTLDLLKAMGLYAPWEHRRLSPALQGR